MTNVRRIAKLMILLFYRKGANYLQRSPAVANRGCHRPDGQRRGDGLSGMPTGSGPLLAVCQAYRTDIHTADREHKMDIRCQRRREADVNLQTAIQGQYGDRRRLPRLAFLLQPCRSTLRPLPSFLQLRRT
ncbi:hypothetical protein RvY_02747-2 [Ramazzottius varieornatus]|uniref:Uncharacterized protein n=1 Tax=Ramazzottius varieornatus TaxID=947166 RepID=A0A1D1UKT5_RAMVA|nr:hypothetical protein RvY_02747-2 [Ramazzottius varieornatus]